jgi:hypothetical protein
MFSSWSQRRLRSEQGHSLASKLKGADILHGDEARIEIVGVGVKEDNGALVLCFCPSSIPRTVPLRRATAAERRQPLPTDIHFSEAARRQLQSGITGRGFAHLRADLITNGVITFQDVEVLNFEPVDEAVGVNGRNSYEYYSVP